MPDAGSNAASLRLVTYHLSLVTPLAVRALELFHKRDQRFDAFARESVIDGRADAADRAMALQPVQSRLGGFGDELLFEVFARQPEGDVHQRAAVSGCVRAIEIGRVNRVI